MVNKRIRFNKLDNWQNGFLVLFSMIFMITRNLEIFGETNNEWNKMLGIFSIIGLLIFFARMTLGKYYVGWNKAGISIRIKSYLGKSFSFKDVKSINLENAMLTVVKENGRKIQLDVNGIEKDDVDKLLEILVVHTSLRRM